jgi:hypothetical protein
MPISSIYLLCIFMVSSIYFVTRSSYSYNTCNADGIRCVTGWVGFPLLLVCCCGAAFSAVQLGKCWNILERRWPDEFSGHVRYPYPSIALKAAGFKTRYSNSYITACRWECRKKVGELRGDIGAIW